jgi:hypothetical protein
MRAFRGPPIGLMRTELRSSGCALSLPSDMAAMFSSQLLNSVSMSRKQFTSGRSGLALSTKAISAGRDPLCRAISFWTNSPKGSRFDSSAVDAFRSLLKPERRRDFPLGLQPSAFLERNGLLVNGSLTRTGVLLFHSDPDTELVSAYVQCALFDAEQKRKSKTTESIRGNVYGQIAGSIDFVRRNTRCVDRFAAGPGRTIRLDQYPIRCLREVLANAVCHRDYSDNRGESEDEVTPTAEVIKAMEEEQFAYINSRGSALNKLAALRLYAQRDPRSAHRVLKQLTDLPPTVALTFLREETGWDGEDLTASVSNWIYQGKTSGEVLDLLIEFARSTRDARTVAYVYYAILANKLPIEKSDFFLACWRPTPSDLTIETVEISAAHGPVSFLMGSDDPNWGG